MDQTVIGLGHDPLGLVKVSRASGVPVVAATGTYTAPYLPEDISAATVDELAALFVREIEIGMDGTSICAGLIGEIGCSWPLVQVEQNALKAAAITQRTTGAT